MSNGRARIISALCEAQPRTTHTIEFSTYSYPACHMQHTQMTLGRAALKTFSLRVSGRKPRHTYTWLTPCWNTSNVSQQVWQVG